MEFNHPSVFGKLGKYENLPDLGGAPDDDARRRGRTIDAITTPELMDLMDANTPKAVRQATRDFATTVVATERDTFGASYQYETQTFLKVLTGLRRHAERGNNEAMAAEYGKCAKEITSIAQLMYWAQVFAQDGKSMGSLGARFDSMPTATMMYPGTYETLFNLPPLEDAGRPLGENIDRVVRACMAVGMCEDPTALQVMRNSPGWKLLFKDALEEIRYFGKVERWDKERIITTDKSTGAVVYDSLKSENERGSRCGLSAFGNIWARPETSAEADKFRARLVEFAGGDELAVDLGLAIFKTWALDAEYGAMYVAKDGRKNALLEGYPNASDLVKLRHFSVWQTKQNAAGHPCGPRDTRGLIKTIFTSFPKFATTENTNGEKRTIYESMWGYSDEPALRLGSINWGGVVTDEQNNWGTRINVPSGGKEGNGLFAWLKSESADKPDQLLKDSFWELFKLNLNVAINDQLVLDGRLKGSDPKEVAILVAKMKKYIATTYWKGIQSLPEAATWLNESVSLQVPLLGKTVTREKKWTVRDLVEHRMRQVGLLD